MPWSTWKRLVQKMIGHLFFLPAVDAWLLLTFSKACDCSGHIFGARASPRSWTKNWLCPPLPLFVAVSMIPNMLHSSGYCMRYSWLTEFGVLLLNQLVANTGMHGNFCTATDHHGQTSRLNQSPSANSRDFLPRRPPPWGFRRTWTCHRYTRFLLLYLYSLIFHTRYVPVTYWLQQHLCMHDTWCVRTRRLWALHGTLSVFEVASLVRWSYVFCPHKGKSEMYQ